MTFLRNAYIVLGAVLGIATVYLAPSFLTSSSSKKKSKTNEENSTGIYLISASQSDQKNDDNEEKEREAEVSSLLVQNQSNEETIMDKTEKAIIDGIALIPDEAKKLLGDDNEEKEREAEVSSLLVQNQSNEETIMDKTEKAIIDGIALIPDEAKKLLGNGEREKKSVDPNYSIQHQNNEKTVSTGNASENLAPINQTPAQNQNNEVLNGDEKEKIVKKTYVKKCGEENVGVVLEYVQTNENNQLSNDWNVNFKNMEESSSKYDDANDHFVSVPNEVLAPEKLNATIYESFEDSTKHIPFKPPRIRKATKSESFQRSKLVNKNISIISSKKPSAQSTLIETNTGRIEVKGSDDIEVLAEESNIYHSTFESDNFRIESKRHKSLGHGLWRRYVYVFGNLLSWKKRASDRSKLLDSQYSTESYNGNKINLIDLIEDDEGNFERYKKIK